MMLSILVRKRQLILNGEQDIREQISEKQERKSHKSEILASGGLNLLEEDG